MVNYCLRCFSVIKNTRSRITLFCSAQQICSGFAPLVMAYYVIALIIYTLVNEFISLKRLFAQLSMYGFSFCDRAEENFLYFSYLHCVFVTAPTMCSNVANMYQVECVQFCCKLQRSIFLT